MTAKNKIIDALLARERVKRLKRQNQKLAIDLQHQEDECPHVAKLMFFVTAANLAVKSRLLGLSSKLAPRLFEAESVSAVQRLLDEGVRECLQELADVRNNPSDPNNPPWQGKPPWER